MGPRPLSSAEQLRLREQQRAGMVPRLQLSVLAGAVMFVTFAGWDELVEPGAGYSTLPLRALIAGVLTGIALALRTGWGRAHPDLLLYLAAITSASGISYFTSRLPEGGQSAAPACLILLLMLIAMLVPRPLYALVASVLTLGIANVLGLHLGLSTEQMVGINLFAGSGAVAAVLMARLNDSADVHSFQLELELETRARTDSLCGILNRGAFMESARRVLSEAQPQGKPVSALLLDLDHFKLVNDTQGHAGGDEALRIVSGLCQANLRPADLLCRMGGEEIGILLPGAGHEAALKVAERIRCAIAECRIQSGSVFFQITTSIGVATMGPHELLTLEALYEQADRALYAAKAAGRNRVVSGLEIAA